MASPVGTSSASTLRSAGDLLPFSKCLLSQRDVILFAISPLTEVTRMSSVAQNSGTCMAPCLCCISQWTSPPCRRFMTITHFSVQADGSLPCSITLPSEYEAESHQRASLWEAATSHPALLGSPAHPTEEELPGSSHTAPGDLGAHPTRRTPREMEDLQG